MTSRLRVLVALASLVFFVVHVRALPRTLEDIDSINFALGVESFDVAAHRPHPPGYPVLIALAKVSTAVVHTVRPSWDRDRAAAVGLAVWGLVAGTLATWVFTEFWLALGLSPPLSLLAALLAVVSPLFWFTAARPLSDTPGLVAGVAVVAGLAGGLRLIRAGDPIERMPRQWLWAACGAGFIIGLRTQTMWMTGPLLFWCAGELVAARRSVDALKLVGLAALGALLWAVPLVWATGGLARYLAALTSQGSQDFSNIEMLATTPNWRLFKVSLGRTFVEPWLAATLAKVVLGFAAIGLVRLMWTGRRIVAAVLLAFWPYLVFHMVFQETITIRYSLPLLVPVAGLAVVGVSTLGIRLGALGVAAAAAVSLLLAQPPLEAYAANGAPVFRAFQDMQRALPATSPRPALRMHHQVWHGVLRIADWYRPYWDTGPLPFPKDREWLDVVRHWRNGETVPVWFLAELTRNDLALFDRRSRTLQGRYETPAEIRALMGGVRLDGLSWWTLERPAWMLGTGWSLTPEIAGMTSADASGPHLRLADAFLRRGPEPRHVMIGGRYVGGPGESAARVLVELDGRPLAEWIAAPNPNWFVQWLDLPAGVPAGDSPYARLTVHSASTVAGRPAPAIFLEQFDAAPNGDFIVAFADGWHEYEENPGTGRLWRWTSDRSTLVVKGADGDLRLRLSGESPLRYFDRAPTVVVRAGDRELARFQPAADFTQEIDVPAPALAASGGRITIETDKTFVPGKTSAEDQRRLGLKMFQVEITKR